MIENQSAPYFIRPVDNQIVECGMLTKFSFPEIKDIEDDYNSIKVQLANATTFMTFSVAENSFTIQEGATNGSDAGLYTILVTLSDMANHQRKYSFNLNLTCEMEEEVAPVDKFPGVEVLPEYEPDPDIKSLKARVKSVSPQGVMTLVFDRLVRPITNATLLEEGQVLVEGEPKPMLEINAIPG